MGNGIAYALVMIQDESLKLAKKNNGYQHGYAIESCKINIYVYDIYKIYMLHRILILDPVWLCIGEHDCDVKLFPILLTSQISDILWVRREYHYIDHRNIRYFGHWHVILYSIDHRNCWYCVDPFHTPPTLPKWTKKWTSFLISSLGGLYAMLNIPESTVAETSYTSWWKHMESKISPEAIVALMALTPEQL